MSLQNLDWAMQLDCPSPLSKLALLYLADNIDDWGDGSVEVANLVSFCCAPRGAVLEAVYALDAARHCTVVKEYDGKLHVVLHDRSDR